MILANVAFFEWLVRASWQAAVLVGLVLMLQWVLGRRLSARWRAALWGIVLVRLVMPALPASRVSVFNLVNAVGRDEHRATIETSPIARESLPKREIAAQDTPLRAAKPPVVDTIAAAPAQLPLPDQVSPQPEQVETEPTAAAPAVAASAIAKTKPGPGIPWKLVLAIVWASVASLLLARIAVVSIRLRRSVRGLDAITDERVLGLFESCKRDMAVRRKIVLLDAPRLSSPALVGALSPRLLLPMHVLGHFSRAELRLMFLHELAHVRRNDVAVNWLCTLLGIAHWFNPALWLAFARMKSDRELACDELVLARSGEEGRRFYGYTILKLLQTLSRSAGVPGVVGILEGMHPMRRRIVMIANFGTRRPWPVLAALAGLALAAVALTDAVAEQKDGPTAPAVAGAAPAAADEVAPATQPTNPRGGMPGMRGRRMRGGPEEGRPSAVTAPEPRGYGRGGGGYGGGGMGGMGMMGGRTAMGGMPPQPAIRSTVPKPDPAVEQALRKDITDVKFEGVPFRDVMDALRDQTGLNMKVDWKAIEAAGIPADTSIQLRLKNVPAGELLRQVLIEAGSDTLGYRIEGNILVITTRDVLDRELTIKAYDVSDLVGGGNEQERVARMQELLTLIRDTVSPQSWADNGGASTIRGYDTKMIIATTESNHNAIEKVLTLLRGNEKSGGNPRR